MRSTLFRLYPFKYALIIFFLAQLLIFSSTVSTAQVVVTTRFANPEYDCDSQTYTVDVEFQSNTASKQLFGINVRFFYNDADLEFISFGEYATGYGPVWPNPPAISTGTAAGGNTLFGFDGPNEYVNGAVQKVSTSTVILSTTGWTKLFNISFQVVDPTAFNISNFCPSLVWDLEEDPSLLGFGSSPGVVMTIVSGTGSAAATPNVVQFNWQYDGIPGYPYGLPAEIDCVSTICSVAPTSILPLFKIASPGEIIVPVTVTNFFDIGSFSLAFEYDTNAMEYIDFVPNAAFNGLLSVIDTPCSGSLRMVVITYTGNPVTLANNASVAEIGFNFLSGLTELTWVTDGTSCQYIGSGNNPLYDIPYSNFYIDGSVELLVAPLTKTDSITAIANDYVSFAVRVWDYSDIIAGFLTLTYDPAVLTYYSATSTSVLNGSFQSTLVSPGTIEMQWSGSSLTLDDGTALAFLTFIYEGGDATLTWFDDGTSCQYISGDLNLPLYDDPSDTFYLDGNVAPAEFIWTGEESNDWNNSANWINNIVPDQFTDVTIDPTFSRSIWPSFMGDFTLGVQCKNLILNGNSQFYVSGDLTINPGHVLEMTGQGVIQVGGSWTNSGTFIPGTGTVEFGGTDNASISEGVPPENYLAAYELSAFTDVYTFLNNSIIAVTGDNAHADVNIGFGFEFLGETYTQVRINTNGWLSFILAGDDATSNDNTMLFDTQTPGLVLAPWWDDLKADENSVVAYKIVGTSPSKVFTAEWKNILAYSSGSTARLNFQIKLREATKVIEFRYANMVPGTHNPAESASIGIKDAIGGPGNFIEATHNSTFLPLPCLRSENDWPTTHYKLTPPVANETEFFNRVMVTKQTGQLAVQKDTWIMGID